MRRVKQTFKTKPTRRGWARTKQSQAAIGLFLFSICYGTIIKLILGHWRSWGSLLQK
jgi:hypothetical protein